MVPVLIAGLVGASLGAGNAVAWQTGVLPFTGEDACWGSLSDSDLTELFGDRRTRVDELTPEGDPAYGAAAGECRIISYRNDDVFQQMTIRLHELDGLRGRDRHLWPDHFLSAWMTSLGGDLTGMSSPDRAWVALPESCTGDPGNRTGGAHTVVDVASGLDSGHYRDDAKSRSNLMARVAVQAAGGAMEELGCEGKLPRPRTVATPPEPRKVRPDKLCGVDGLEAPPRAGKDLNFMRISDGPSSPARTCAIAASEQQIYESSSISLRFTTIEDPFIGAIFTTLRSHDAPSPEAAGIKAMADVEGKVSPSRAMGVLECPAGRVVVMVEQREPMPGPPFTLTRTLLPDYLEAEAQRLNCGPIR